MRVLIASFRLERSRLVRCNALLGDMISAGHSNAFACRGHAKLEVVVIRPSSFYCILDGVEHTVVVGIVAASATFGTVVNVSLNGSPCAQEKRGLANCFARMDSEGVISILEQANIERFRDVVEGGYFVRPRAGCKNTSTWPDPSVIIIRINNLLSCTPSNALDVGTLDLPYVDSWVDARPDIN